MYLNQTRGEISNANAIKTRPREVNPEATGKIPEQSWNREVNKRILVVDDDWMIRDMTSKLLNLLGYAVFAFEDSLEALSFFMKNDTEVVLTDLMMPGLNGWELARNIKKYTPDVPVILMTGTEKEILKEGLIEGDVDFLLIKPFRMKQLDNVVNEAFKTKAMRKPAYPGSHQMVR
ncbi:MAG: response regulator [Deltaproteobacteria bacterium]|nr:response regulator [Deltaproteobacteria bacterium]